MKIQFQAVLASLLVFISGTDASATPPTDSVPTPFLAEDVGDESDPEEEENACPVFRMNLAYSNYGCMRGYCRSTGYIGWNRTEDIYDRRTEERPSCLDTMINEVADACRRSVEFQYIDDCVVHSLQGIRIGQDYRSYPVIPRYADFIEAGDNALCNWVAELPSHYFTDNRARARCDMGRIFFDGLCRALRPDREQRKEACFAGRLRWEASPISLLFDVSLEEFRAESRVVQFALEPSRGGWSVWKASAKAPLLVYDPASTGSIRTAAQLFGHWTFGGKRHAANRHVNSAIDSASADGRWENGFEALGSLDQNGDQKVSGAELDGLGLWFDANQNGESEAGEVKPLAELNITALYYQVDQRDPVTKDLIANVGYERVIDGKKQTGTAVDWFGESAQTKLELVQRQMALGQICEGGVPSGEAANPAPAESAPSAEEVSSAGNEQGQEKGLEQELRKLAKEISGSWNWKADSGSATGGILVFSPASGEEPAAIQGASLIEAAFEKPAASGASGVISLLRLTGSVAYAADGAKTLSFKHTGDDGLVVESTATLSAEGDLLSGKSIAKIPNAGGVVVGATYSWTARRKQTPVPQAAQIAEITRG